MTQDITSFIRRGHSPEDRRRRAFPEDDRGPRCGWCGHARVESALLCERCWRSLRQIERQRLVRISRDEAARWIIAERGELAAAFRGRHRASGASATRRHARRSA